MNSKFSHPPSAALPQTFTPLRTVTSSAAKAAVGAVAWIAIAGLFVACFVEAAWRVCHNGESGAGQMEE